MATQEMRELHKLIERCGLKIEDQSFTGSGHFRALLKAGNGNTRVFIFGKTPSDSRSRKNDEALLRRFARENLLPTVMQVAMAEAERPRPQKPDLSEVQPPKESKVDEFSNGPDIHKDGPKRQINRLDGTSAFRLHTWFAALPQEILDAGTPESLAKLAEDTLQFPVTKGNIVGSFEITGRQQTKAPKTDASRLEVLERRMMELEAVVAGLKEKLNG